jgi:hypothetical protein
MEAQEEARSALRSLQVERSKLADVVRIQSRAQSEEIWSTFVSVAESVYTPLIDEAMAAGAEARAYAKVLQRMRDDVERFSTGLIGQA